VLTNTRSGQLQNLGLSYLFTTTVTLGRFGL
jgi:hypothetical protein